MARDTSEHERPAPDHKASDIPARVRCRRDADGIVVWVPEDEPDWRPAVRDAGTEGRQGDAHVDQG